MTRVAEAFGGQQPGGHPAALLSGFLVIALSAVTSAQAVTPTPEEFARALQRHYDTVRDFSADFSQTYEGGVLRKRTTERGSVVVGKPGRMRWTYTAPEEKLFVSDGRRIYSYVPADRQAVVSEMPAEDQATTPVLFLVGKGNLLRDFSVSYIELPGAPADSVALRLVPRQAAPEYEWLALAVDRRTLALRLLVATDRQGGRSTFVFTNLKENVGTPDKAFRFTIPPGTDVITRD